MSDPNGEINQGNDSSANFSSHEQKSKFLGDLSPASKFRRISLLEKAIVALTKKTEKTGSLIGKKIGRRFIEDKRARAENFDVTVTGEENLEPLKDKSFIVAANHIRHEGPLGDLILTPDAFILGNIINRNTTHPIQTVVMEDSDMPILLNRPVRGLERGFINEQQNLIRVKRDKKKPNIEFVRTVGKAAANGNPILTFPEGNWYKDWDPSHKLENSAALIAQMYHLPIIPTYIRGARNWKPNTHVDVAFGAPIDPKGKTREEVMEEIRQGITQLQQSLSP